MRRAEFAYAVAVVWSMLNTSARWRG
jgi:hypothetical protein